MDVMLIAALVGPIAREWRLDVITVGNLMSIGYLGMFIGALVFGRLADVIGRKAVLVIVLFLESVFTAACGLSQDVYTLAVLRFIAGVGLGGALPQPGVYVSEYIPVKYRGLFLGLVEASWVYGALLSLLIPYFVLPSYGWRVAFFTAITPIILVPLVAFTLPESIRYLLKRGDIDKVKSIIVKSKVASKVEEIDFRKDLLSKVKKYTVKDLFSTTYFSRTVLLFILWGGARVHVSWYIPLASDDLRN
jgi:putative MFS transporter